MSNFYALANETLDQFRRADGSWTDDLDDAEHLSLEAATEKQIELIRVASTRCKSGWSGPA